jgi:hypothetical protein
MKFKNYKELKRNSDDLYLMCTGETVNDLEPYQWDIINKSDSLAMNNFFYHPHFIPTMLSMELKTYDYDIAKRRLAEKWDMGWKNVKYILPDHRVKYLSGVLGSDAQVYVYHNENMGTRNSNSIDANVVLGSDFLWKLYNASVTTMFHLAWLMGYKNVIVIGMTGKNSRYFWTDMSDSVRGEVHAIFNKDHEHQDPSRPHHASHVRSFVIDFRERHMVGLGRNIWVGSKKDMLYPDVPLWNF